MRIQDKGLRKLMPQIMQDNKITKAEVGQMKESVADGPGLAKTERKDLENILKTHGHMFDADAKADLQQFLGIDASTTPSTPTPGGTSPMDVRLGGADNVAPPRAPVLAFKGESTFPSPYKLNAEALGYDYNDISAKNFGTTDVLLPNGATSNVKDMHYDLGDGKFGMNLLPVSDYDEVTAPDGSSVPGHKVMDDFLRKEMGLGDKDPIFALIAYVHPEMHTGDLRELGGHMLKTEMGSTHMGAYIGDGNTSNSPEGYHDDVWEVRGYPANVQVVSLDGVDQGTLNKNARLVDAVLNEGVEFPDDYKNDKFRTVDLNTTLMFYKDWINGEDYQHEDNSWMTYCAEHKTIVTNTMLNVPHNEESFKEIFGSEGGDLWKTFKQRYEGLTGKEFTAADETHFEPLWKKEGLTADQIKPFTKEEYDKYDMARFEGNLDDYNGMKPLDPGVGMAWPPETTADLITDFVECYASFADVGGELASSILMGFKDTVQDRMGTSDEDFYKLAIPAVNKMMLAEAMVSAPGNPAWFKEASATLYVAFGGDKEDFATGDINPDIMGMVGKCMTAAKEKLTDIMAGEAMPRDEAYEWMRQATAGDLAEARKLAASDPGDTQYYSPPAVSHRASIGIHESNQFVNIKTVCTAVDSSELDFEG